MKRLMTAGMVLAMAIAADANVISINFDNTLTNASYTGVMEPTDLAGAPGVRVGNWNGWFKNDNTLGDAGQTIIDDNGSAVAGFTATGSFGWASRDNNSVNDEALFSDIVDVNTSTRLVNVSGVPYGQYDVYVYMRDDSDDRAGEFVLGSDTYFMRGIGSSESAGDPASDGTGYVLSTDTSFGVGTDIDQGNYVKFSNVSGESFQMAWTAVNAGDGTQRAKVAGFQVVQIPEPGTMGLIVAFGGALLFVRRRFRV